MIAENVQFLPADNEAEKLGITPRVIGYVRSSLKNLKDCPHWQSNGPEAVLEIKEQYSSALEGLNTGKPITLITWFHLADRKLLQGCGCKHRVAPRGVFSSRSPARPNPIGVHEVTVVDIRKEDGFTVLLVNALEALDGTPILDIKRGAKIVENSETEGFEPKVTSK